MLRLLYDAESYGFEAGDPNVGVDMYVLMQDDPSTMSGQSRSDNNIYVNFVSASPESAGGLLAHEWEHYEGRDAETHNTGMANNRQAVCSQ
jgi:hypothetical protein